ncbi:splicing factor 3B subunit 4-like [Motacilla alba alba]|uniref:splicing factor 3B subunit 4-like n=1 Tax=Motacilla alba alba TaxID=1094192 RepID=UPI0018D5943A|nr:splicing factor 3B subunit 4-like [Motacilla alba alba]
MWPKETQPPPQHLPPPRSRPPCLPPSRLPPPLPARPLPSRSAPAAAEQAALGGRHRGRAAPLPMRRCRLCRAGLRVTSATSRSQRASEHQRGTGDGHKRGQGARPEPTAGHLLPKISVPAPASQGGTRVSPGGRRGQAGCYRGTRRSHPSSPRPSSPAPPRPIRHAGLSRGGSAAGRPPPPGCTATRCCHLSLGVLAASPNCCEQEIHLAEDPTSQRRMVAVATPLLMSREGRRPRVPTARMPYFRLEVTFWRGEGGLFPYLLDHLDN